MKDFSVQANLMLSDKVWPAMARAFESATGVTLLVDESPQMVLLSSFDPVRREVAAQPEDAPYDSTFAPWNRDLAFNAFYARQKGRIDVPSVARLYATSPINLSHACAASVVLAEFGAPKCITKPPLRSLT